MALALLANTAPRIVSILNANPGTFLSTVSGNVGAFPSDAEILAATLEADEWVVTKCYFASANEQLSTPFDIVSANLVNGDNLPFSHGRFSKVEYSENGSTGWVIASEAKDADDIIQAAETYVGAGTYDFLYGVKGGHIYTKAPFVRVTYPEYTRTAVLQANKNEESLIVFRAVAILAKNASPALFEYYNGLAEAGRQEIITEGVYSGEAEKP